MKKFVFKNIIFLLAMAAAIFSGCDKQPNTVVEEPEEPTNKELFCSHVNVANIDQTIPIVNEFLSGLSTALNDEQQLQMLATWLKSCPCIIDASVLTQPADETDPPKREIDVSFDENETTKRFIMTVSMEKPMKVTEYREYEEPAEDDFCTFLNEENIEKTIPFVDDFLRGLSNELNDEQKLQALAAWLKSQPCILDATIASQSCIETGKPISEIDISFDEKGISKRFFINVEMTNPLKIECYRDCNCEDKFDACGEEFYYYDGDKKIFWDDHFMNNWLHIAFYPQVQDEEIVDYINQTGLFKTVKAREIFRWNNDYRVSLFAKTKEKYSCSQLNEIICMLEKTKIVAFANFSFCYNDDCSILRSFSYEFYVQVKDKSDLSDLRAVAKETNTRIMHEFSPYSWGIYGLRVDKCSKGDAMQMARYFYETGKFILTDPRSVYSKRVSHLEEDPIEIPFTEYIPYIFQESCLIQYQNIMLFDEAILVNSNEELEKYMDCSNGGSHFAVDFSKNTLIFARGGGTRNISEIDIQFLKISNIEYSLYIDIYRGYLQTPESWFKIIEVPKLPHNVIFNLNIFNFQ